MDKLYIIIPAYNEEENIETVAREWHEVARKANEQSRIAIIDDGSCDSTYAKLQQLQKELPQLEAITKPNGGHGSTILYGYRHALENGADYIFQTDSDGQTDADEFWQFWELREQYDALIGHRKNRKDGISRIFVAKTLKVTLLICFGLWTEDANTPFRLMNRDTLENLLPRIPKDYNLANVLLTVLMEKAKVKIHYLKITFRPRQGGVNYINMKRIFKIGKKAARDFISLRKAVKNDFKIKI
ncbi:MAG: glycosyltransferase family 2 protein [Oscillospiraceae bacterium]|nr:glycosyltransferase family 2 protein [Oscillospiraceae bacterium]